MEESKTRTMCAEWVDRNAAYKETILINVLSLLLKALDDRDELTSYELVESGYGFSTRNLPYYDWLHDLWLSAINFSLILDRKPILTKEDFLKPLPEDHIGYRFHRHHYHPIRDKQIEETSNYFESESPPVGWTGPTEIPCEIFNPEKHTSDDLPF